jgi:hypothetical protein
MIDPVKHLGNPVNHQKMYDFERDILRVKNPLTTDFEFVYDMLPIVVPAQGTRDMERYLVRNYIWAMIGHIYQLFAAKKMVDAEDSFRRTHPDVMDDPYLINTQIYDKMKRADNPEFQKKVIDDCIVGVVRKYGSDRQLPKQIQNGQLDPNTPLYMSLIDGFKTIAPEEPAQEQPIQTTQPEVVLQSPTQTLG